MTLVGWVRERLGIPSEGAGAVDARLVVVDTETSGLDPDHDLLLSIGAVAVDARGIHLGDSFEVVLWNDAAGTHENVAVHGIGHGAQSEGVPADVALAAYRDYVAGAPCVGFHCDFDRRVLDRAGRAAGVALPPMAWLDLAPLGAALLPERARTGRRSLDDWLAAFRLSVVARHSAAGDALATAELLLRLRALAVAQGAQSHAALTRLAQQQRWLGGPG